MKITTGLVTVTFRKLSPARVIALARQAGLAALEWAGDAHVPPGDLLVAREVGAQTRDAGLIALSYGSYYRAGSPAVSFETILETAVALGVRNIRIWAGSKGSRETTDAERQEVLDDMGRAATLAQSAKITVSLERHGGTLTDVTASTVALLKELRHPNLFMYWQPAVDLSHADALVELRTLLPWLSTIHVFHWAPGTSDRLPLADGRENWREYFSSLSEDSSHAALMEFVRDDSEEAFLEDARVLKELAASLP